MSVSIKRLGPGDEAILELLAKQDADFDLEGRGHSRSPLSPLMAQRYLASASVLHWVATEGSSVIGFLYCAVVLLRSDPGHELLLYEVGVRQAFRRQGIGRALLSHMESWMRQNAIREVWVCADNRIAVEFYRDSGFTSDEPQPLYLTRELEIESEPAPDTLPSFG